MFNLGVDGDDGVVEQHALSRQLQQFKNPMMMMQDDEPSPRGEEHTPLVNIFTTKLLRSSFSLKALSMALMSLFFLGFGGRWVFTFHSHPEMSNGFHLSMAVLTALQLLGTLGLGIFQAFVADDSKWTKGFRTGSKILAAAVSLDAMAVILRMCEYAYLYESLSTLWWAKYNVTKADWTLFAVANILDGLALLTYGCGLFYLECYHDKGTSEELGWSLLILFLLSGASMLTLVLTGYGAIFMLLFTASAYAVACYWSFLFEPLLLECSPKLHSRDINTDIVPDEESENREAMAGGDPAQYYNGTQTFASMPSMPRDGASAEIPTHYDYSQLQQQVSQGLEMGVVMPQSGHRMQP